MYGDHFGQIYSDILTSYQLENQKIPLRKERKLLLPGRLHVGCLFARNLVPHREAARLRHDISLPPGGAGDYTYYIFKMAGQTTTAKFSDLYDLKEELGK